VFTLIDGIETSLDNSSLSGHLKSSILLALQNILVQPDIIAIGIHVGDIIVDNDDIFGDGVNIAAREAPKSTKPLWQ